jgi:signal transduction histidine kinase
VEAATLKTDLENIVHESTDGTGIKIRAKIEDIQVSAAKHRFLCNTLKEGISNGLRHGNATAFWFELIEQGNKICFLLSDNGTGAEGGEIVTGFGLHTMRERVKAFGGEISFHSEADEGFEISIVLPCDSKRE